jgi:hypothetical protein
VVGKNVKIGKLSNVGEGSNIADKITIGEDQKPITLFISGSFHKVIYSGKDEIQINRDTKSINEWQEKLNAMTNCLHFPEETIEECKRFISLIKSMHFHTHK